MDIEIIKELLSQHEDGSETFDHLLGLRLISFEYGMRDLAAAAAR